MPELSQNNVLQDRDKGAGAPWKVFLFSILLLGTVIAGYAGLRVGYMPYVTGQLNAVNASLASLAEAVPEKEQANLFRFYSQLVNLKGLLDKHVIASKVPAFLEKTTNAKVAYANVAVDAVRRAVTLEGLTDRYDTLAEQLEAVRQSADVESYLLQESRLTEGKVRFRISAILRPTLFRE